LTAMKAGRRTLPPVGRPTKRTPQVEANLDRTEQAGRKLVRRTLRTEGEAGMAGQLDGRVALVTGAASGIGRAGAVSFGGEGAKVVVSDVIAEGGTQQSARSPRREAVPPSSTPTCPTSTTWSG